MTAAATMVNDSRAHCQSHHPLQRQRQQHHQSAAAVPLQFFVESPFCHGTTVVSISREDAAAAVTANDFLYRVTSQCLLRKSQNDAMNSKSDGPSTPVCMSAAQSSGGSRQGLVRLLSRSAYLVSQGKIVTPESILLQKLDERRAAETASATSTAATFTAPTAPLPETLRLRLRLPGGMDRQNRVGSKFGGGGVSSASQTERERKERLKQLALESIDLAKDPYLVRNHLGSYECKLCLTLHRDEANYLAHTQGKKHQQGLARRAHQENLIAEQQQQQQRGGMAPPAASAGTAAAAAPVALRKIRIGRPAYQVYKSRDADTNQRCLSFELHYPEIDAELHQPRHRFMSAFEQRVEHPANRHYQYLLLAAEPYETVAFKIPNEPIDKGEDRFVTHWDAGSKKFTLTLHFMETVKLSS